MSNDSKKAWRLKYRAQHATALKRDRQTMRTRHVNVIRWLRVGICHDCREWDDALHFDHVRGPKLFNIGNHLRQGLSWAQLMEEVMKCERVCADCHAARTKARGSAWRPGDPETPF